MIKNIVFDVGNVIVDWTAMSLGIKMFDNDEAKAKIAASVFQSPNWYNYDLGILSIDEIIALLQKEFKEEDYYIVDKAVREFVYYVDFNKDVCSFAFDMKMKGYNIYLLTNFGETYTECVKRMPIRDIIDGIVASADVNIIKPDERIYKILFEKYNLKPEECLFIDDLKANCDAALKAGMGQVINYHGDINQILSFDFSK